MRDKELKSNKNEILMKSILKVCMGIEERDTWVGNMGPWALGFVGFEWVYCGIYVPLSSKAHDGLRLVNLRFTPEQHQQSCHNCDGAQSKFTGDEHIDVGARASGAEEGSELTVDDEHESK